MEIGETHDMDFNIPVTFPGWLAQENGSVITDCLCPGSLPLEFAGRDRLPLAGPIGLRG